MPWLTVDHGPSGRMSTRGKRHGRFGRSRGHATWVATATPGSIRPPPPCGLRSCPPSGDDSHGRVPVRPGVSAQRPPAPGSADTRVASGVLFSAPQGGPDTRLMLFHVRFGNPGLGTPTSMCVDATAPADPSSPKRSGIWSEAACPRSGPTTGVSRPRVLCQLTQNHSCPLPGRDGGLRSPRSSGRVSATRKACVTATGGRENPVPCMGSLPANGTAPEDVFCTALRLRPGWRAGEGSPLPHAPAAPQARPSPLLAKLKTKTAGAGLCREEVLRAARLETAPQTAVEFAPHRGGCQRERVGGFVCIKTFIGPRVPVRSEASY